MMGYYVQNASNHPWSYPVNDRSHTPKKSAPSQNVDAFILPVSHEEKVTSEGDGFFGYISTKEISARPPDVEELGLQNVATLRDQVSYHDYGGTGYQYDEQNRIKNGDSVPQSKEYVPLPESSIHSVFEEETIELNPASGEQIRTESEPETEERKKKLVTSFSLPEYSRTSLIDSTLQKQVCSEPFLSEDDLLFLMKNDEFIGKCINRKTLKKALKRTGLDTSYKRFRSYMAG